MSHSPQRKEKDCLNCGTIVQGRYCHNCGQENIAPKETFLGLVHHFFADITHFDGKFFTTLAILFKKPGFLSKEFMIGRRNSYLNPIRMYVFSSALFFLIFFNLFHVEEVNPVNEGMDKNASEAFDKRLKLMYAEAKNKDDSLKVDQYAKRYRDSVYIGKGTADDPDPKNGGLKFRTTGPDYKSQNEYDSIQNSLPGSEKDGWIRRTFTKRFIAINIKYEGRQGDFWKDALNRFLHTLPYLLFVSLPLYALFLKLLHFRRKNFYYADHAIFLIHLYIFTFIVLLFVFGLSKVNNINGFGWLIFLQLALIVFGIIYALRAMKRFYEQGWGKTIWKFIVFNLLCFLTLNILFAIFFLFTFYSA